METVGADQVSEILDLVKHWPFSSRVALARLILETLVTSELGPGPSQELPTRSVPAESVVGLFNSDREPLAIKPTTRSLWKIYEPEEMAGRVEFP